LSAGAALDVEQMIAVPVSRQMNMTKTGRARNFSDSRIIFSHDERVTVSWLDQALGGSPMIATRFKSHTMRAISSSDFGSGGRLAIFNLHR
jgi:hypothetical protein